MFHTQQRIKMSTLASYSSVLYSVRHPARELRYTSRNRATYTSLRRFVPGSPLSSVLVSISDPFLSVAEGMFEGFEDSSPSGFALFREVTTTPFSFALAGTGRADLVAVDGVGTGGSAVGLTKLGIGGWDEDAAFAATALCHGILGGSE